MSTRIYIPTRGRVGLNRQVTLREFLKYSSHKPVLVCPVDEVKQHKAYYPRVLACGRDGIGPTRQWIMETSSADVVVVASDDMRFSYRPDPKVCKLERCFALDPMMDLIEHTVKGLGFIHGGIGARQANTNMDFGDVEAGAKSRGDRRGKLREAHVVQDCDRVNDFHFFDREAVLNTDVRWDMLPVMEDFFFSLSLITKGYPNTVIHTYCWNQEASGKTGGCSIYRTAELQAQSAQQLHLHFPKYVKVVTKRAKETSEAWKDFKERTDVKIYWLKAWKDSQKLGKEVAT